MLCQEQRHTDSKRGGVVPVTFSFKVNLASILKKEEKRSSERKFAVVLMFVWKPPTLPYAASKKMADFRRATYWKWRFSSTCV